MALFTPEELEELRRADEELEAEFVQSQEEIEASRNRDREAKLDGLDNRQRKIADYRNNNRDAYNAYMREYMRKRRQRKKEVCGAV